MSRSIDYYFSVVSPWDYIGHRLFREVADAHNLAVHHKPLPLGELFSETGGLPLAKRHPNRQHYRMMELQRWRDRRGLSFNLWPKFWPFDSRLGDGVIIAALDAGLDPDPFLRRVFPAVWEEQRDLADASVITELADASGLPGAELVARASDASITATLERNRQDAIEAGVFGAPAYVLDGEIFWGQDRIELLGDALKSGRKAYRGDIAKE